MLRLFRECALVVEDELKGIDVTSLRVTTGMGADGTPTSELDRIAEDAVLDHLNERTAHGILSEECGLLRGRKEGTIIIDPIDGTSNALGGIPFYSISLAFTTGTLSDTVVGYVKNIPLGREYYAIKGEGSYVIPSGGNLTDSTRISNLAPNDELNFSVYMGIKAHPDSFRIASLARRTRSLGCASLEMCMVAEGTFDLYHVVTIDRERSLRITDIAASTLILREAGGEAYQSPWDPLDMEPDPRARRDVIAMGDMGIKEVIT